MKFHASPAHDNAQANVASLKAEAMPEGMLDHRSATTAQRKLNDMAVGSEPVQRQFALNARADGSDRVAAQFKLADATVQRNPEEEEKGKIQPKLDPAQLAEEEELGKGKIQPKLAGTVQKKENKTGLPDQLKSGVETLSGMSMDNVKVHYNSPQPAQLNALAYAQGSDIHVGPGQEQHLPHEAWHVVQQAQGRVQPTTQMKEGTPVNNDPNLEAEADTMGAKAMQMRFGPTPGHHASHK